MIRIPGIIAVEHIAVAHYLPLKKCFLKRRGSLIHTHNDDYRRHADLVPKNGDVVAVYLSHMGFFIGMQFDCC